MARGAALGALTLGIGCSSADLPPTPSSETESTWQRVEIQVPPERLHEFPEGAGLVRPTEGDWWLAFLPAPDIERLEQAGFVVRAPAESLLQIQAKNGPGCSIPPPHTLPDRFCPYSKKTVSYWASCKRPIEQELMDAPTDYPPPLLLPKYVESLEFGTTFEGRKFRAVRIGKLWKPGDDPVPQMVVFAGDHGLVVDSVVEPGQPTTLQRVNRLLASQLPLSVFAGIHGIELSVVDSGMAEPTSTHARLLARKIAHGTRNSRVAPGMSIEQVHAAIRAGMEIGDSLPGNVVACAGIGEGSREEVLDEAME